MTNPLLLSLEGIDCSGKSTLHDRLRSDQPDCLGPNPHFTHEPQSCLYGTINRELACDPIGDLCAYVLDRSHHVHSTIDPALRDGRTVVTDRYQDSTRAYQSVALRETVKAPLEYVNRVIGPVAPEADLTLYLDCSVDTAIDRQQARSDDPRGEHTAEEEPPRDYLIDVADAYRRLASDHDRITTIDAEQSPDNVYADAIDAIETQTDHEAPDTPQIEP